MENNIELRSEKVRNIIGKIPPRIVRNGISILCLVFVSLLIGSYYFPYTESKTVPIQIFKTNAGVTSKSSYYGVAYIPLSLQSKIEIGLPVRIEIEGYNANKYGQFFKTISKKGDTPILYDGKRSLLIMVSLGNRLVTTNGTIVNYYPTMQGNATFIFRNERLLNVLFSWLKR